MNREKMIQCVKNVSSDTFDSVALELFKYQSQNCSVYHRYLKALNCSIDKVTEIKQIPFLPISFFKTHQVISNHGTPVTCFESSSTTGQTPSKHWVYDRRLYEWSFLQNFIDRYGHPASYRILALLPSYLERGNSSLVYMVEYLMKVSGHPHNDFYLDDFDALSARLMDPVPMPTLLIGVTFALLDFSEQYPQSLSNTIIMETGGMKGRAREPIRSEVHQILKKRTGAEIHSEYGMTELFSQAYAANDQVFHCPQWMRALLREVDDPLTMKSEGRRGVLNIIDLANVDSCAFIATDDLVEVISSSQFKVLGRLTMAETRVCSLLYT
jgi:hypothetical protein